MKRCLQKSKDHTSDSRLMTDFFWVKSAFSKQNQGTNNEMIKKISCSPTLWSVFHFLEVFLHQKSDNIDMLGFSVFLH